MKTILELPDGGSVTIEGGRTQAVAQDVAEYIVNNHIKNSHTEEPLDLPVMNFASPEGRMDGSNEPVRNVPPDEEEPLLLPTLS